MDVFLKLNWILLLLKTAHATFTEDLKGCIQKTIATPSERLERVSFCHHLSPDRRREAVDHPVPPEIRSSYFFPDILFWDPLTKIPSIKGFLQRPREACCGKNSFLRAIGWKDGRMEGIILVDFMA